MDGISRRMPTGIQSFEEVRTENYLYVDKTDLVWKIANGEKFNYLSRPRRFGKSILIDTLRCYFEGRRDLFEGLKIMELEKVWEVHPVIRLDMSEAGDTAESIKSFFNRIFRKIESAHGIETHKDDGLTDRFATILESIHAKTGKTVVMLIDEYDSPLQHSWHTPEHEACTALYREVFSVLKSCTIHERFVFITGITKFTQISLFSVLNNLTNISFFPEYAPICGITVQETVDNFQPEIKRLAERYKCTEDEAVEKLREYYDGYHFSEDNMVDIFNPYSLINALAQGKLGNFWVSSGATSMLPKFVDDMEIKLGTFDGCYIQRHLLESSDVTGGGSELFLYQSGYLTIKGSDDTGYILGIPNREVRQALFEVVIPALTMKRQGDVISMQGMLLRQLNNGMLPEAMKTLAALISDVPYSNKKLECMDMEERYRFIISSVLNAIGLRVEVERMMCVGRIDIVTWTSRYTYVMELKLTKNGGMEAAERQIKENRYAEPFRADGRETVALAIELDDMGKGILAWKRVDIDGE